MQRWTQGAIKREETRRGKEGGDKEGYRGEKQGRIQRWTQGGIKREETRRDTEGGHKEG